MRHLWIAGVNLQQRFNALLFRQTQKLLTFCVKIAQFFSPCLHSDIDRSRPESGRAAEITGETRVHEARATREF